MTVFEIENCALRRVTTILYAAIAVPLVFVLGGYWMVATEIVPVVKDCWRRRLSCSQS